MRFYLKRLNKKNKEYRIRDKKQRARIFNISANNSSELNLIREVIKKIKKIWNRNLKKYSYVWNHEWCPVIGQTDKGKGDLVLTDGNRNFLVVECKFISYFGNKSNRTHNRKKVKDQTIFYMKKFKELNFGEISILGMAYTNEKYLIYSYDLKNNKINLVYKQYL